MTSTDPAPPIDHVTTQKPEPDPTDAKWAGSSKSVISITVMLVMVLAPIFGLEITEEEGVTLEKSLMAVAAAAVFILGLVGRAKANTKIYFWRR